MGNILETNQRNLVTPPPSNEGGINWDAQPFSLTTREVAALLGKSPGNVRARASKGDFGPTMSGPDGLPRYDRDRVRVIGERMAARQAQMPLVAAPTTSTDPPIAVLLNALQAQHSEQIALYKTWVEETREEARQAKEEAKELRAVLHEREETTRETLTHMDMLHEQNITQTKETLERERAQWSREVASKDAEIERLRSLTIPEKGWAQRLRK